MLSSKLFGQNIIEDHLVSDSILKKFKIKQITENWYTDSFKTSPENTTIEVFNEFGQKIQKYHINSFYHQFIDKYEYNYKKNIIIKTQLYYDWNPYREKRKGDTIVKKTLTKYDIHTGRKLKSKPSRLETFQPILYFDNNNRIINRFDTIKCGYNSIYYFYNNNNQITVRIHYTSHHNEKPYIIAVDSLHYNLNGQLVSETNYYDIIINENKWVHNREVLTSYTYNQNGLIHEKFVLTKYRSLYMKDYKPVVYRYNYEYY